MQVEQLIITSTGSGESSNRLVARSSRVDDKLIDQLCRLCPSRNSLEYGQRESTAFMPLDNRFVFIRSMVSPVDEQLQRQIINYAVILEKRDFQKFEFHAPNVIYCLRSGGQMRFRSHENPMLPTIDLPDRFMQGLLGSWTSVEDTEKVQSGLSIHEQIAVLGSKWPLDLIAAAFNACDLEQRATMSFAVGRRANDSARFRIYVHHKYDADLSKEFAQQQIRPWSLSLDRTYSS